jgi:hypothetical protein
MFVRVLYSSADLPVRPFFIAVVVVVVAAVVVAGVVVVVFFIVFFFPNQTLRQLFSPDTLHSGDPGLESPLELKMLDVLLYEG